MKIVAIGGGNLALDSIDKPYNLEKINEEIVKLSSKKSPRLLYIGFTIRADYYFSYIKKIFFNKGCQCEYLRFSEFENQKTVENKFKRADIIFLPSGNTLSYMKMVRKFNLDKYLIDAANRGIIIAGISAGAIMCFEYGCSDAKMSDNIPTKYSKVRGLGLEKGLIAPHFSTSDRVYDIVRMLKNCKKNTIAFGIDECAALVINDEKYIVIKTEDNAKVYKCFYKNKEYVKLELSKSGHVKELYQI